VPCVCQVSEAGKQEIRCVLYTVWPVYCVSGIRCVQYTVCPVYGMSGSDADLSGGIHSSCMRHRIQIGATGTLSRKRGNISRGEGNVKVRSNW
jgi:hypothetical protein